MTTPPCEQQTERAADRGQQAALSKELANQPEASRAKRQPDGHFPLSRRRARQHQVGDVGAGDEQRQSHNPHQDAKRFGKPVAHFRETLAASDQSDLCVANTGPLAHIARLGLDLSEPRIERRLSLLFAHAGLEPRNDSYPTDIRLIEVGLSPPELWLHHQRRPNVGRSSYGLSKKFGRRHTDDCERLSLQRNILADDRRISGESPPPETVAQRRHRMRARLLVVRDCKQATGDCVYAQDLKIFPGNKLYFGLFRSRARLRADHLHTACVVFGGKDACEDLRTITKPLEYRV